MANKGRHAVMIGGSMAGLLAARTLAERPDLAKREGGLIDDRQWSALNQVKILSVGADRCVTVRLFVQ